MKKKAIIWLGISVVLLILVVYIRRYNQQGVENRGEIMGSQTRCANSNCFTLDVATTPQERMQGLMFRPSLAKDRGMLFVFSEKDQHAFWMKNTLIPLDMIRLDEKYTIVDIQEAQPCLPQAGLQKQDPCKIYTPQKGALYVIELNQGTAKNAGISVGAQLSPK